MIDAVYVVAWSGSTLGPTGTRGELLPYRPERSALPIDRDRDADRQERQTEQRPPDPSGRRCGCGCGAVLRDRARRRDGRLKSGERWIKFLRGHHRRERGAA